MADFKIRLGVELDTKNIDTAINKYQGKPIEVKSKLDTSGIDKKIASYKTKKPIEVNAKLNTSGLAKKIGEYKPKTPIKLNAKLDTKNIDATIRGYKPKKDVEVNIKLNHKNISEQLRNYKPKAPIKVDVKLDSNDINNQIRAYQTRSSIKLGVKLTTKDIDEKIRTYKAKTPIKLDVKINKSVINEQIKSFTPRNTIMLKAALQKGAIAEEIRKYKPSTPIKVDLELDYSDIDKKVGEYVAKGSVELPVKLKPATKGFSDSITKKPIRVNAELNPEDIKTIEGKLMALQPETPIIVKAQLDDKSIDSALMDYQAKSPTIKIDVRVNDDDINKETKKQSAHTPIEVNVRLNREKLNEQIRNFKTKTPVKVDVKLVTKGIADQIKKINPKTPIKIDVEVGNVKLDENSINNQIHGFTPDTPLKLGVQLDMDDAKAEIERLRSEFQKFGKIVIQFPNVDAGSGVTDSGSGRLGVGGGGNAATIKNAADDFDKFTASATNVKNVVSSMSAALDGLGVDLNHVNAKTVTEDLEKMGIEIQKVVTTVNGSKLKMSITGIQETEDGIKRVVTRVREFADAIENPQGVRETFTQTFKTSFDKINVDFGKLERLKKEINNINKKIVSLDPKVNTQQFEKLSAALNKLETEYNELRNSLNGSLSSSQIDRLDEDAARAERELDELKAKIIDVKTALSDKIKIKIDDGTIDKQENDIVSKFNNIKNKSKEAQIAMSNFNAALKNLKTAADSGDVDKLTNAYQDFERALKSVKNQLDINARTERDAAAAQKLADDRAAFQSKIDAWLTRNSAAAEKFGDRLLELRAKAESCDSVTLDHLEREFKQVDKEAEAAGLRMQNFGDRLRTQWKKYSSYLSVASFIMYAGQAMRNMFEQVKLIDSAMTELKKVTNETDEAYNQFLTNAASRAKAIGTTIDGLVSSTADFARLGYGFEDSQKLAEVANIYAVVGDEIDGVEEATQSLVSTLAAFKDEMNGMSDSDFAMSIVDKMNEVSNNFAISSGGIGEALQRSASSMAAANNTLDETIAMITAANEVAQNPEKVGNAMKTMSMRIRGAKTE